MFLYFAQKKLKFWTCLTVTVFGMGKWFRAAAVKDPLVASCKIKHFENIQTRVEMSRMMRPEGVDSRQGSHTVVCKAQ
jgi:hypothetical protein